MADLAKLVEELSSLTLLEAAELKTMLEEEWGVTAAAPMAGMMMAGPAAEAAGPEQTEFDVIMTDFGPKKIQVIRAVRSLTDLGLKEAKELVENIPSTISEQVGKDYAEDVKAKLEAEGATVELK